jgi:predicted DNA-binding transcriptional regulator AlpA
MDTVATVPQREPYLTKAQVADHYGFSPRWVELRVGDGMPCYRFGGRVRFRLSEVESWLQERAAA